MRAKLRENDYPKLMLRIKEFITSLKAKKRAEEEKVVLHAKILDLQCGGFSLKTAVEAKDLRRNLFLALGKEVLDLMSAILCSRYLAEMPIFMYCNSSEQVTRGYHKRCKYMQQNLKKFN